MRLKYIKLNNFMCFENTELTLPNNKIISICGNDLDRNTSNGIGKCVKGDTLIYTNKGIISIESLFPTHKKGWYNPPKDLMVLTHKNRLRKVTKLYCNGLSIVYKLKTKKLGLELIGTPNHPVLTLEPSGIFKFKEFNSLRPGDIICINRNGIYGNQNDLSFAINKTIQNLKEDRGHGSQRYTRFKNSSVFLPPKLTPDLSYILGAYIGDGSCNSDNFQITLTDLKKIVFPKIYKLFHKYLVPQNKTKTSNSDYILFSKALRIYLTYLGIPKVTAQYKEVPFVILRSSKVNIQYFLAGYFDTDGCVNKNGTIEITSASEKLIRQIQLILLSFGIISVIKKRFRRASNTVRQIRKPYWSLYISSSESIKLFKENIPLHLARKRSRLEIKRKGNPNIDVIPFIGSFLKNKFKKVMYKKSLILYNRLKSYDTHNISYESLKEINNTFSLPFRFQNILSSHYFFDQVDVIEREKERVVTYDLEVQEDHSFITNNIVSHNSSFKEAILFALFGKTKVNLSDLITKGKDKCSVIIEFEEKNNIIKIKRSYSKSTTVDIWVNGKLQDLKNISAKNKFIQDLIGCNYETFINFSIFDAIRFEDLSELSSNEIKRLFRMLFNYEKFERIINDLKIRVRSIDKSINLSKSPIKHYYSSKRINILLEGIKKLNDETKKMKDKINKNEQEKTFCLKKISELETIIRKNKRLISWLSNKDTCPTCDKPLNNKFAVLNKYQKEINESNKQLKKFKEILEQVTQLTEKYNNRIREIDKRITKLKMYLHNLELQKKYVQNLNKLEENKRLYSIVSQLMDKFSLFVLEHYIENIEVLMNKYLEKLTDIRCKISFMKSGSVRNLNKFYITLIRNKKEFNYMQLSSGERLLVAYAFKMAINTLSFKNTFLFVDEGLGRLDDNNRAKLYKLFELSPFNQVFIVSHYPISKDINRQIYITKKDNVSTLSIR